MPSSANPPSTDSTDLMVASRIIGKECSSVNQAFLECKIKDENPKACLPQGERVTSCVFKVLRDLETHCSESFAAYKKAMDDRWHVMDNCRPEQHVMEDCWRLLRKTRQEEAKEE